MGGCRFRILIAAFLCLAALPLHSFQGQIVGEPRPWPDVAWCFRSMPDFVGSDDASGLFVFRERGTGSNDIQWIIDGGRSKRGCIAWNDQGYFHCPGLNFQTPPTTEEETAWAVVTLYPNNLPGGTHDGWLMIDNTSGLNEDLMPGDVPNVIQRLRVPQAKVMDIPGPSGMITGVEFSFEYPTEFGTRVGSIPCDVGGRQQPHSFENRLILGFNVYRLGWSSGHPSLTTPHHYLCGRDGDCTTPDDNGIVTFIPLGDCGSDLCVDDPSLDPDPTDAYRLEDRGAPNPHVVFMDFPGLSPDPVPLGTDIFFYVYQPVVKGSPTDTWQQIPALDLDADGTPEFLDPGGNGLGLTANTRTRPFILISQEAIARR